MFERSRLSLVKAHKRCGKDCDCEACKDKLPNDIVGEGKKSSTEPFVKGCVVSVQKNKHKDLNDAFAICRSNYNKAQEIGTDKKIDKEMLARKGWSKKMHDYESALARARKHSKKK